MESGFIEFAEMHAIETNEAVLRSKPEEPVRRLQNGIDRGLE